MICPNCQHENPSGARFCNECGNRLEVKCSSCGAANPPDAKFCNECGSKLRELSPTPKPESPVQPTVPAGNDALVGQRRRVAVIFADVSGSTALGEKYDAEVVFEVMNECFAGLSAVIAKHEGHVLKYIGDCLMALFGAPIAHGDDPQRAVLAGMEMQEWLAEFSQKLLAERGLPFRMRVGINYGMVVAGGVGSDLRMEYDVLGDAVNVAQRLEAAAEPGTVYVSDSVERLVRAAVEFESVGLVQVKGRAQGVQVFRAVRQRKVGAGGEVSERPDMLVGRDAEVEELRAHLLAVEAGEGRFRALSGEPGIGKTALVEKTASLAAERGSAVFLLSGAEKEVHEPFAVLRHWLRQIVGAGSFVEDVASFRAVGMEVAPFAVELALLLHPNAPEAPSGLDPETRLRLQVQGVVALVKSLAVERPVLLGVDDLQWLDPSSQEVVRGVVGGVVRGEVGRVLLLAAYRAGTPPEWVQEEELDGYVHTVCALEAGACLELMRHWIRPEDLPENAVAEILERSGGHPHYLVELLRHLVETEQVALRNGHWEYESAPGEALPDSLYGAVAARLDRLQGGQRTAVQSSSVVGQQFPLWLVRDLEPTILWDEALADLAAMHFLDEQVPPPEPEYRFRQAIVREVAYDSLLLGRRKQLHTRVAERLEARIPAPEAASALAWHLERAELWQQAAHWHREAGHWAGEAYANADALSHFEKCILLLKEHGGDMATRLEFQAHRGAGEVAARLGDYERAIQEYTACLDDGGTVPEIASAYCQLARCRYELGGVAEAEENWRAAFRHLQGGQDSESRRVRSNILSEWGFAAYRAGRYRRALRLARWSYEEAQMGGALLEQGDATNLRALAHQERGEVEEAIRWYDETRKIAEQTGDAAALATVQNNLGTLLFAQGHLKAAEENYLHAEAHWVRVGDRTQSATLLLNLGNVALARGEYEAAHEALAEAAGIFSSLGQPYGAAAAQAVLGEVCLEMERLEEARAVFAEALSQAGDLDAPDLAAYAGLGLAETALRSNDLENVDVYLREAGELISRHELVSLQGQELRLRGRLMFVRGQREEAEAALRDSLTLFGSLEARQEMGRTLMVLAEVSGDVSLREEALGIFREVGAEGDLRKVQS